MTAVLERLTSALTDLRKQHVALDRRIAALEARPNLGAAVVELSKVESRLEALEHASRNSELILFGIKEIPSKNPKIIVKNIANALGVEVGLEHIVGSFRIPARGDRPRPLVLRFSLREVRYRLLAGKRARSLLDGLLVSGL